MKTAIYGTICTITGVMLARYTPGWPVVYSFVVSVSAGGLIAVSGYVIEALTTTQHLWGEDRHE